MDRWWRKIRCQVLGWHKVVPDKAFKYFDGASFYGTCKYCHARCLYDSQGNWFSVKEK